MIGIINYGSGNIQAISNIYNNLKINNIIVNNFDDFSKCNRLILPGVGSFDFVMNKLNSTGLVKKLNDLVLNKQFKILGICVGMQILGRESEEGIEKGLGWLDVKVKKIKSNLKNNKLILPHMGWNNIQINTKNEIIKNLNTNSEFYFLHSYFFDSNKEIINVAYTNYHNLFPSIINYKNIYGVQFHPEKSHDKGELILKNFAYL